MNLTGHPVDHRYFCRQCGQDMQLVEASESQFYELRCPACGTSHTALEPPWPATDEDRAQRRALAAISPRQPIHTIGATVAVSVPGMHHTVGARVAESVRSMHHGCVGTVTDCTPIQTRAGEVVDYVYTVLMEPLQHHTFVDVPQWQIERLRAEDRRWAAAWSQQWREDQIATETAHTLAGDQPDIVS